jgi:hypothetical protein
MLYSVLNNILGSSKDASNTQLKFNCPKCAEENFNIPDDKYNLEVNLNYDKGLYKKVCNCWKCGLSGPLFYIIKKYATKEQINEYIKYENEVIITSKIDKKRITKLPKEFISFNNIDLNNKKHVEAFNYLVNTRKVDKYLIKRDNIGFCIEGYYKDRLVFPSYDQNNKINFFVTRDFTNLNKKEAYKLPYAEKKDIIFNEKNINWNSTIYLVEAYLEYTVIPFNTIPLLGTSLFDNIIEKIVKYKPPVVICLNPDALKKRNNFDFNKTPKRSEEIKERLNMLGVDNVKILYYNNEDDLNKNLVNYGKSYIFNLLKNNIK